LPATNLQNSTYLKVSATLASYRLGSLTLASHRLGSLTWPSESYRRKTIEGRKQHPEPGLATAKQRLPAGFSQHCQPQTWISNVAF